MNVITEDYVSFEIAKLLKEKGFDENCAALYHLRTGEIIQQGIGYVFNNSQWENFITAPTLQMAMKWLREVHNTCISVDVKIGGKKYYVCISNTESGLSNGVLEDEVWDTYEDACEAAIKYCLENLI